MKWLQYTSNFHVQQTVGKWVMFSEYMWSIEYKVSSNKSEEFSALQVPVDTMYHTTIYMYCAAEVDEIVIVAPSGECTAIHLVEV